MELKVKNRHVDARELNFAVRQARSSYSLPFERGLACGVNSTECHLLASLVLGPKRHSALAGRLAGRLRA